MKLADALNTFDLEFDQLRDVLGGKFDQVRDTLRPILTEKASQIEEQTPAAIAGDAVARANIDHLLGQMKGEIFRQVLIESYDMKRMLSAFATGIVRAAFAAALS